MSHSFIAFMNGIVRRYSDRHPSFAAPPDSAYDDFDEFDRLLDDRLHHRGEPKFAVHDFKSIPAECTNDKV